MQFIVKDKSFYKSIFLIAVPIALQNIVSLSVNLMDTVMIGMLGDIPLAASALANQVFFILAVVLYGVASGSNVMSAQFWGKNDVSTVRKVFSIAQKLALLLGIIFMLLAFFMPERLLFLFTNDAAVVAEGVKYLRIVCLTYAFYAVGNTTVMMFRSVGNVNMSVAISLISLCTNVFWNWVLIFGNLGAPALGIQGAALATLIARVQEFIIVMIYLFRIDKKISYKIKDLLSIDKKLSLDFFKTVLPVMINELMWSLGASAITAIIGRLSTDFLAANSVVMVITQVVNVAMIGIANASGVVIGNKIGEGKYEEVKLMARTIMIMSLCVGSVSSMAMLLIRPIVVGFYDNLDPQTLDYIYTLMTIISGLIIFQSVNFSNMMGVLRGGGDAKFVLFCDLFFMWTLCIPMGFIGAFYLNWSVPTVYIVIKSDEILKFIVSCYRTLSGKWVRDVTI